MTSTAQSEIRRLQEENAQLRQDKERITQQAASYAAYGDVLKTIALLPLATDTTTDRFMDRAKVALMLHGIEPDSQDGAALAAGFLQTLIPDRERLVRAFTAAKAERMRGGNPKVTPGCECSVCTGIVAAEQITHAEAQRRKRKSEEIAEGDYFLTKSLQHRVSDEDSERAMKKIENLRRLFDDMGFGGLTVPLDGPLGRILNMLLGGDRGRGGVEVMMLGPGGLEELKFDRG